MVKKNLDQTARKILRILQDEGRISNLDLSKKIDMSPPPTLRRVRDLENKGFIDGFRANLNPEKLGYDLTAWIFVSLKNQNEESLSSFEKLVWGWESVRECYMLNGEIDFIKLGKLMNTDLKKATFIPEIWQGHKNGGEGFWIALKKLEKYFK